MDLDLHWGRNDPFPLWKPPMRENLRSEIMKRYIPEEFRDFISKGQSAKKFIEEIKQYLAKNDKAKTSNLLGKFIPMKCKCKGNIKGYIMEMSNLASKLQSLKLELGEDLLMHLVLILLPVYFGQFKVSYNTQKGKWSLDELISLCKRKKGYREIGLRVLTWLRLMIIRKWRRLRMMWKGLLSKENKKVEEFTSARSRGTWKKECPKYATWHVKKGKFLTLVSSKVNLAFVPMDTWWVDFGAITHINMSLQGCLWNGIDPPSDDERFIFVGNGAIGTFRLQLKTGFYLDLFETFVVPSFRWNLISISSLDKFGFSYSFRNNKVSLYQNSNIDSSGSLIDNIYMFDVVRSYTAIQETSSHGTKRKLNENSATLWHKHLGHISKQRI